MLNKNVIRRVISSNMSTSTSTSMTKEVWILRHGQATHNPRAEKAREEGCSFDEFLELMRQDDSLDSPLTDLGKEQAKSVFFGKQQQQQGAIHSAFDLVVSSPLSRALQTADLAFPPTRPANPPRVCCEHFREINGLLLNAKRRSQSTLEKLFPQWDFSDLSYNKNDDDDDDDDPLWKPDALESTESCGQRGYQGFQWLLNFPLISHEEPIIDQQHNQEEKQQSTTATGSASPQKILLVTHGGILSYTMMQSPPSSPDDDTNKMKMKDDDNVDKNNKNDSDRGGMVTVKDGRTNNNKSSSSSSSSRFGNAELRRYRMEWLLDDDNNNHNNQDENVANTKHILLTQLDIIDEQ